MSSVPRRLAYNIIVSSGAKVLSTLAALTALGFIARYLAPDEFGWYITALAFFSLFNALGDWGLYQTSTREFSRPEANEEDIISNVAGLRIVLSLLILLLAPIIVYFLPYSEPLKLALIFALFSYVFYSFYQILIGLFQKRLLMDRVTLAELAGKIIQVGLIIAGVTLNWGFQFIVATLMFNMLANFILVFFLSRRFIRFRPRFDFRAWKDFMIQSWPIGLSVLITFIYFKADTILLSLMKPAEDVGIYGAGYKVIESLNFFPGMIVGLILPMLAFNVFSHREKFVQLVNKNFKVFVLLVIPLAIGTLALAPHIINIVAGEGFESSALVLRIIIFSLVFIFFGQLFNSVLISAKLQKQLLWALLSAAVLNIILNLIFIPRFSYLATASVSVLTELWVAILGAFLIKKHLSFLPRAEGFCWMLFSGFLMGAFLWFFIDWPFLILLLVSPVIYFASIFFFQVISKDEIMSLVKKKVNNS